MTHSTILPADGISPFSPPVFQNDIGSQPFDLTESIRTNCDLLRAAARHRYDVQLAIWDEALRREVREQRSLWRRVEDMKKRVSMAAGGTTTASPLPSSMADSGIMSPNLEPIQGATAAGCINLDSHDDQDKPAHFEDLIGTDPTAGLMVAADFQANRQMCLPQPPATTPKPVPPLSSKPVTPLSSKPEIRRQLDAVARRIATIRNHLRVARLHYQHQLHRLDRLEEDLCRISGAFERGEMYTIMQEDGVSLNDGARDTWLDSIGGSRKRGWDESQQDDGVHAWASAESTGKRRKAGWEKGVWLWGGGLAGVAAGMTYVVSAAGGWTAMARFAGL